MLSYNFNCFITYINYLGHSIATKEMHNIVRKRKVAVILSLVFRTLTYLSSYRSISMQSKKQCVLRPMIYSLTISKQADRWDSGGS